MKECMFMLGKMGPNAVKTFNYFQVFYGFLNCVWKCPNIYLVLIHVESIINKWIITYY